MAMIDDPSPLMGLPAEIWHGVGGHLSASERRSASLANKTLRGHLSAWRRADDIFTGLLPPPHRRSTSPGPAGLRDPSAPVSMQRQQQAVQLYQSYKDCPKDRLGHRILPTPMAPAAVAAAADGEPKNEGRTPLATVRRSEPLDIETLLVLPERGELLVVGHEPGRLAAPHQRQRLGHSFLLEHDDAAPWRGELLIVPPQWLTPRRLAGCGADGIFGTLTDLGSLQFWRAQGRSISHLPPRPDHDAEAQRIVFSYGPRGTRCMAFCSEAVLDPDEGIAQAVLSEFAFSGHGAAPDDTQSAVLTDVFGFAHPMALRTLTVAERGQATRVVTEEGDIVTVPLMHHRSEGAAAELWAYTPKHPFMDAAVSPGQDVIILRDRRHSLHVWRPGKPLWTIRASRARAQGQGGQPGTQGPSTQLQDYRLSPHGNRLAMVFKDGGVQLCSTMLPAARRNSVNVDGSPIVHAAFSPYSHAMVLATAHRTCVWLPLGRRSMLIKVPHLGPSAQFVPGLLRLVGQVDGVVHDVNLAPRAWAFDTLPCP